jgi:hypothetical protein
MSVNEKYDYLYHYDNLTYDDYINIGHYAGDPITGPNGLGTKVEAYKNAKDSQKLWANVAGLTGGSGIVNGVANVPANPSTNKIEFYKTLPEQPPILITDATQHVMLLTNEEAKILQEIRAKGNSATIKKETVTVTTITERRGRKFKEAP